MCFPLCISVTFCFLHCVSVTFCFLHCALVNLLRRCERFVRWAPHQEQSSMHFDDDWSSSCDRFLLNCRTTNTHVTSTHPSLLAARATQVWNMGFSSHDIVNTCDPSVYNATSVLLMLLQVLQSRTFARNAGDSLPPPFQNRINFQNRVIFL